MPGPAHHPPGAASPRVTRLPAQPQALSIVECRQAACAEPHDGDEMAARRRSPVRRQPGVIVLQMFILALALPASALEGTHDGSCVWPLRATGAEACHDIQAAEERHPQWPDGEAVPPPFLPPAATAVSARDRGLFQLAGMPARPLRYPSANRSIFPVGAGGTGRGASRAPHSARRLDRPPRTSP